MVVLFLSSEVRVQGMAGLMLPQASLLIHRVICMWLILVIIECKNSIRILCRDWDIWINSAPKLTQPKTENLEALAIWAPILQGIFMWWTKTITAFRNSTHLESISLNSAPKLTQPKTENLEALAE